MTWCPGPLLVCLFLTLSPATGPEAEKTPAQLLWEMGQESMLSGETDQAIDLFTQSLKLDPTLARNYLSLAACYLDKGADQTIASHLKRYLELQPDHHTIRAHYAEVLARLKQYAAAREQLERFVVDIQDEDELAGKHLASSHGKLMQIAREEEDDYAEHLNRGIGLFWLACQTASQPEEEKGQDVESLLCRAAAELSTARLSRPDEARPCWYLYEVWTRLAQSQPAQRSLRAAEAAAPFTYLTPAEQRGLSLAVRQLTSERPLR